MKTLTTFKHFPGNLAVLLRNAPSLLRDGMKSDAKAFWVLALVTPAQKSGEEGMSLVSPVSQVQRDFTDIKNNEISPRWPPVLSKGAIPNATWELTSVDATSISFVVNRILKVIDQPFLPGAHLI